jgi:membrane associated rhomboid family serine protease
MKKFFYEYGQLNWLYVLFAANVIGFIVAFFAFTFTNGQSALFFAIHSGDFFSLLKIWKLFTYSITSPSAFGLIGNLLWLWIFGDLLANVIGGKNMFSVYVFTTLIIGVIGGVFCIWGNEEYPVFLLGFDAALIAIAAACVYKVPQQKVVMMLVGGIPVWVLGIAFLLVKIFTTPNQGMAFMLLLDFIALLIGVFYIILFDKGKYLDVTDMTHKNSWTILKKKKKLKGKLVSMPTAISQKNSNSSNQERLDKILEKISEKGIDGISKEEKKFLENYSKQ